MQFTNTPEQADATSGCIGKTDARKIDDRSHLSVGSALSPAWLWGRGSWVRVHIDHIGAVLCWPFAS